MWVARVRFARSAVLAATVLGLAAIGASPAVAQPAASVLSNAAGVGPAFKVNVYPAYTTAGLPTTFEVTITNAASSGAAVQSVQIIPPVGFKVAHPASNAPLRRKILVQNRTFSVHGISVKPGAKMEFDVTATAPHKCGHVRLRWSSHAFQGATPTGTQLALQPAASRIGVTVACPQLAACGDGGPACSTNVNTSVSTYGVVSNAAAGTLHGTLDVGSRLTCGPYRFHDPNWYDSVVTPPTTAPPPAGTAPIVDVVSYAVKNTTLKAIGFCLGAAYDFVTASGNQAPAGTLPSGNAGFIGLLPMCTPASPPCISSISQQSDPKAKTGYDAVLSIEIPELGDPWGGS